MSRYFFIYICKRYVSSKLPLISTGITHFRRLSSPVSVCFCLVVAARCSRDRWKRKKKRRVKKKRVRVLIQPHITRTKGNCNYSSWQFRTCWFIHHGFLDYGPLTWKIEELDRMLGEKLVNNLFCSSERFQQSTTDITIFSSSVVSFLAFSFEHIGTSEESYCWSRTLRTAGVSIIRHLQ